MVAVGFHGVVGGAKSARWRGDRAAADVLRRCRGVVVEVMLVGQQWRGRMSEVVSVPLRCWGGGGVVGA